MRKKPQQGRPYSIMVAMVVGAALSAVHVDAATATPEPGSADERAMLDIYKYCQACWRNARLPQDDWTDCTQEVFVRLLERVKPSHWSRALSDDGDERRELVRAIDTVKKRVQRRRTASSLPAEVRDHRDDAERNRDWECVDRAATKALSPRQREVLELSRDGWSVPEIAQRLDTTPERISDEKYKAIKKLRKELGVG